MSTVWISKKAGHDFESARQFGELRVIFETSLSLFNPDQLEEHAVAVLKDWKPGDWLLFSGPILMNVIAFNVLAQRLGEVPILLFNAMDQRYLKRICHGHG